MTKGSAGAVRDTRHMLRGTVRYEGVALAVGVVVLCGARRRRVCGKEGVGGPVGHGCVSSSTCIYLCSVSIDGIRRIKHTVD